LPYLFQSVQVVQLLESKRQSADLECSVTVDLHLEKCPDCAQLPYVYLAILKQEGVLGGLQVVGCCCRFGIDCSSEHSSPFITGVFLPMSHGSELNNPLNGRLKLVTGRLNRIEDQLDKVAGVRGQVSRTNSLLSNLRRQSSQFDAAHQALNDMRSFRLDVEAEGQRIRATLPVIGEIADLHDAVSSRAEANAAAMSAWEQMAELQGAIVAGQPQTEAAEAALQEVALFKQRVTDEQQDLAAARSVLDDLNGLKQQLLGLKSRLLEESTGIVEAANHLNDLVVLKDTLNLQSGDMDLARESTDGLIALKDEIVIRGGNVGQARQRATQLLEIGSKLVQTGDDANQAQENLQSLMELQNRLKNQTSDVAAAVQNLEILADFQLEFERHLATLEGMRRSMVEVVMLESTIGRVVRVLQPLVQIANLRRLNDGEVREAARLILERRSANAERVGGRIAERPKSQSTTQDAVDVEQDTADGLVPLPAETE
jgi:hypothetical protein